MTGRNEISTVGKVLILQILMILVVWSGFSMAGAEQQSVSSVLGGAAAFLPNLYFAFRISLSKGKAAKEVVHSFYAGESGKLILTVLLFFLIFQIPNLEFPALLAGYVAVLSVFWFALILWRD